MKVIFRWLNSYPDNKKLFVGWFAILTIVWIMFFAGFLMAGITWSEWFEDSGTAGTIIFFAFVLWYLICAGVALFTKRNRLD